MSASDELSVAFLGASHAHAPSRLELILRRSERFRLGGIFDSDSRVRTFLADEYGVRVTDDPEQALRDADLVFVEGYDYDNPGLMSLALGSARAVLLEKPGAPTVEKLRHVVGRATAAPVYVRVGYMMQTWPITTTLREVVNSGVLGHVTLARLHAATPAGAAQCVWESLPGNRGGVGWSILCHIARLGIELLGAPERVMGTVRRFPRGRRTVADAFRVDLPTPVEGGQEAEIGTLAHEDLAAGILDYSHATALLDITAWEAENWISGWRVDVYGTDATLRAGLQPPWIELDVRRDHANYARGLHRRALPGPGSPDERGEDKSYTRELDLLAAAALSGSTDQSDLRAGLTTMETLDALFRSSQTGCAVALEASQ